MKINKPSFEKKGGCFLMIFCYDKKMIKDVKIYTTSSCGYCKMVKDFLKKNNIEYTEFNVGMDAVKRNEILEKTGQMGVPVIDINGEIVIGFDKERLSKILGI